MSRRGRGTALELARGTEGAAQHSNAASQRRDAGRPMSVRRGASGFEFTETTRVGRRRGRCCAGRVWVSCAGCVRHRRANDQGIGVGDRVSGAAIKRPLCDQAALLDRACGPAGVRMGCVGRLAYIARWASPLLLRRSGPPGAGGEWGANWGANRVRDRCKRSWGFANRVCDRCKRSWGFANRVRDRCKRSWGFANRVRDRWTLIPGCLP